MRDKETLILLTLRQKCRLWLNDAIYCYGARDLPRNRQVECILGGEHWLREKGPKRARDYIFTVVEKWADTKGRTSVAWSQAVRGDYARSA